MALIFFKIFLDVFSGFEQKRYIKKSFNVPKSPKMLASAVANNIYSVKN